jgi:hypothetical protein
MKNVTRFLSAAKIDQPNPFLAVIYSSVAVLLVTLAVAIVLQ